MSNEHPLDQLLSKVSPTGCHLIRLPNRVWVFGGSIGQNGESVLSQRDAFWRMTLEDLVNGKHWFEFLDRPENHQEWWAFSGYEDLLEFERDACYLARQVILFSESPGSHAELGALALDQSILPRLFLVVSSHYLDDEKRQSFLNLGPIKRVERFGTKCVIEGNDKKKLSKEDYEIIVECFHGEFEKGQPQKEKFKMSDPTHILLLIADLIDLLLVSKEAEITKALIHFDINLTSVELKKKLNLLAFFKLVKLSTRGTERFWTRIIGSEAPWVDYTSKQPDGFDRQRFKTQAQTYIESNSRLNYIYRSTQ